MESIELLARPKSDHGYLPGKELPIPVRPTLNNYLEFYLFVLINFQIKKECLAYEMTETIATLATTIPERYRRKYPKPPKPGAVKKSALTYNSKCFYVMYQTSTSCKNFFAVSEKVTKLAQPKDTSKTKESDLKEDPFTISPNALKYRATPRIQELAQPVDRK